MASTAQSDMTVTSVRQEMLDKGTMDAAIEALHAHDKTVEVMKLEAPENTEPELLMEFLVLAGKLGLSTGAITLSARRPKTRDELERRAAELEYYSRQR